MNQMLNVAQVFASHIDDVSEGQRASYRHWLDSNPGVLDRIEERTRERVADDVSEGHINAISLARYYRIVDVARQEVKGVFTDAEVLMLLDGSPTSVMSGELNERVASLYYSEFGEEALSRDSMQYKLCKKLAGLTRLQELGLIDIIECAWRNPANGLEYAMAHLCRQIDA
ncbi:hypothetical protein [Thauera propionica]|nr:hypothetical protein [Thauera propionica]